MKRLPQIDGLTKRQTARVMGRLSQDALAHRLGSRDKSQISRWERGFLEFSDDELTRIAEILKVDRSYLTGDQEASQQERLEAVAR